MPDAEKDAPVCFLWETYWPHAVYGLTTLLTTPDRGDVTCDACLWALGSQKHEPPRTRPTSPGR